VQVVSWNVNFPGSKRAAREGAMLRPALVLLQEVNPGSAEILRQAASADWHRAETDRVGDWEPDALLRVAVEPPPAADCAARRPGDRCHRRCRKTDASHDGNRARSHESSLTSPARAP
jgi:hypothetical protein